MNKLFMLLLLLVFSAFTTDVIAAEVKNLKVEQSGENAVAKFDLVGDEGELEAEVTVVITIDGVRRTSEGLKLTGDFGKGVKVGRGKKITWNATADLPSDFDGELSWDVQAVDGVAFATMPTGPSVKVLPNQGKSFDQFHSEDATCRKKSEEGVSSMVRESPDVVQTRYDLVYGRCMYSYGNQVPGYRPRVVAAPPAPPPPSVMVQRDVPPPPPVMPPVQAPAPPEVYIDQAPQFIYSPELNMYVAVGVPYDLLYTGNEYFYFYGGRWYHGPYYNGPWVFAPRRIYPPVFLRFRIGEIRHFRDLEFRRYEHDREHYGGRFHRPAFRGLVEHREEHGE